MALPIALQSLLSALVSASDALMLGFLDQTSLSAISLAGNVWFVLNLFQASFMIGASVLGAQYWGKGDKETVEKVLGLSLRASIPVSLLFALAAILLPDRLMSIFTSDAELISKGMPYLRIVSITYLTTGVSSMYLNIMRNSGQVRKSVMIGSTGVVINIILNLVLIFGIFGLLGLGIIGAAIATVIARMTELVWCIIESNQEGRVRIPVEHLCHADVPLRRQFWRHLTPVMANEIVWGGGVTAAAAIMGHLGSDAVAAHAIANIIQNILRCFCSGVGSASGIILGNLMGAGKLKKAKDYSKKLIAAALLSGTCAGLMILALSPLIMRFSFPLTDQAKEYLRLMLQQSTLQRQERKTKSEVFQTIHQFIWRF